jgi:branched-chain amino acid transport system permease protein
VIARIPSPLRAWALPLGLMGLVAAGTGLCALGSDVLVTTATTALIMLVATVGLYIFVGNSGVFSFGHASFMIIGGYTAALLVIPTTQKVLLLPDLPGVLRHVHAGVFLSCIIGGAVAALFAGLLSIPIARLSGMAGALTTFAVLGVTYSVASNWEQVTGGPTGVAGIPVATSLGESLIWALVAIAVAFLVQSARWGRRLRASREDEIAAQACGIGIRNERRAALVISAFVCGVAGGLYGELLGDLTPTTIYLDVTFLLIAMLVVGGINSLSGAVIGSITISVVAELLRRLEAGADLGFFHFPGRPGIREVGLALIMLGVLVRRPDGITGGRELRWPDNWRHPGQRSGPAVTDAALGQEPTNVAQA